MNQCTATFSQPHRCIITINQRLSKNRLSISHIQHKQPVCFARTQNPSAVEYLLTISIVSEPPQKRRKTTARLLPEQHNVITRVPRVEERRSIRVATQLRLRYSTRSPFFRLLPLEIRNMIYKSYFESMARAGDQRIEPSSTELLHKGKMVEVLGLRGDPHDFCPLDIFLVCREMHKEAEPVLWSDMNFLFRSTRLLNLLSTTKQLAYGRPSRSIPLMYPVEKIRGIELEFPETYISDFESDLKTLEWLLEPREKNRRQVRIAHNLPRYRRQRRAIGN